MLQATTPLWTLSAHSEAVTGISISPHCPGIVSTVSQDKMLKVPSLFILLSPEVENISHRFGTSRGPSLFLLGSETLVLAPFTLLPIVPMCLLSSPLGGIKPATTLRCPKWISTLAAFNVVLWWWFLLGYGPARHGTCAIGVWKTATDQPSEHHRVWICHCWGGRASRGDELKQQQCLKTQSLHTHLWCIVISTKFSMLSMNLG